MSTADLFDPNQPVCECAPHSTEKPGAVCSSDTLVKKIANTLNIDTKISAADIIEEAKEELNCTSESCVLKEIKNTAESSDPNLPQLAAQELETRFKVSGPANTTQVLSNIHIDKTMEQWAKRWKFFQPIPFQYIDFAKYDTVLQNLDCQRLFAKGITCAGCVLNTDSTGGRGKHWVCIFIDMRDTVWTIEYFNSSGNHPPMEVVIWAFKIKNSVPSRQIEFIKVSTIMHQLSKTECGMFVLYYIYNRIKGKPYTIFRDNRIEDEKVTKFRKHIFIIGGTDGSP